MMKNYKKNKKKGKKRRVLDRPGDIIGDQCGVLIKVHANPTKDHLGELLENRCC
jgi:hypothetical protein